MSITLSIAGTVQATDSSSGVVALKKTLASLSMTGTAFAAAQSQLIGTSPVTIALPASPAQFLYLKNLDGANTVTVTWTPLAGSTATILKLEPGAFIAFGEPIAGGGITALSVVASAIDTDIEYLFGG